MNPTVEVCIPLALFEMRSHKLHEGCVEADLQLIKAGIHRHRDREGVIGPVFKVFDVDMYLKRYTAC